jgi:hypothetical protein
MSAGCGAAEAYASAPGSEEEELSTTRHGVISCKKIPSSVCLLAGRYPQERISKPPAGYKTSKVVDIILCPSLDCGLTETDRTDKTGGILE